jgi:glycosyltransferase involved in cell wall biosynthesis
MANARPIVAARAAAVPETVVDGETGFLAAPDDPDAFARGLATLLADPELRRHMGAAGRRRVESYRADRVAEQFLGTVQAALEGRTLEDAGCGVEAAHPAERRDDDSGAC